MRVLMLLGGVLFSLAACGADTLPPAFTPDTPQISLEMRFVSGPPRLFEGLRKQFLLRTPQDSPEMTLAEVDEQDLAGSGGIQLVSATQVVETQAPVFADRLADDDVRALLGAVGGDVAGTIMLAPKVTIFDGQVATVDDVTLRPFVVGFDGTTGRGRQPAQIRQVAEGTKVLTRCRVLPGNTVRVDFRARLSSIGEVGQLTLDRLGTAVQVPQVAAEDIQLSAELPSNGTLAVYCANTARAPDAQQGVPMLEKVPYVSKLFKGSPPPEPSELVILLTPRIIPAAETE